MYDTTVDKQRQVVEVSKNNKMKRQLQFYFPQHNVDTTMFAFQSPRLPPHGCRYNFDGSGHDIESVLPPEFTLDCTRFAGMQLYELDGASSTLTCRHDLSTDQDRLVQMFIYKQQLANPQALILHLMQYKTLENYNPRRYAWKSKRDNCCFENLVLLEGSKWGFFNHDNCTYPNTAMLTALIHRWYGSE